MKLTKKQRMAMSAVYYGADVYDYGVACDLREIERSHPSWIQITNAVNPPKDGAKQQPYFGAMLTRVGQQKLKDTE